MFGPHTLELGETRVGIHIDDDREVVDVQLHHPVFAEMPEEARSQVTFLVLDWLLGEDGVERWLGHIESVADAPTDSLPADALVEIVDGLAARREEIRWALLEGERDGAVVLVSARRPLKWIEQPLFDQHIAIEFPYTERNPAGLPERPALERLRSAEDDLLADLGDAAILAAHETTNGLRTFHFYADSQDPSASECIAKWATQHPTVNVRITADPGWTAVRPFA
jgi:hypothetical protein